MRPKVHYFADEAEAYNASQCDDAINDGDVLVAGRSVGVLVKAWPTYVVGEKGGEFHHLRGSLNSGIDLRAWLSFEGGKYLSSARIAREVWEEIR